MAPCGPLGTPKPEGSSKRQYSVFEVQKLPVAPSGPLGTPRPERNFKSRYITLKISFHDGVPKAIISLSVEHECMLASRGSICLQAVAAYVCKSWQRLIWVWWPGYWFRAKALLLDLSHCVRRLRVVFCIATKKQKKISRPEAMHQPAPVLGLALGTSSNIQQQMHARNMQTNMPKSPRLMPWLCVVILNWL